MEEEWNLELEFDSTDTETETKTKERTPMYLNLSMELCQKNLKQILNELKSNNPGAFFPDLDFSPEQELLTEDEQVDPRLNVHCIWVIDIVRQLADGLAHVHSKGRQFGVFIGDKCGPAL